MRAEHFLRVTGFLSNDVHHQCFEINAGSSRCSGNGGGCCRGCKSSATGSAHVVNDLAEGAQGSQFSRLHFRQSGFALTHGRKNFNALDTVDAEVGLQFHVCTEHFLRVAGFFGNDAHHQRFEINA